MASKLPKGLAAAITAGSAILLILGLWWGLEARLAAERRGALESAERLTLNLVKAFDRHVQGVLARADSTILDLRRDFGRRPESELVDWARVALSTQPFLVQLAATDHNGRLVFSSIDGQRGLDLSDRAHIRGHLDGTGSDGVIISTPVLGRVSNRWSIQLSRPMFGADGRVSGVIVASVDPLSLSDFFGSVDLGPKGSISLVGDDGFIRALGPPDPSAMGRPDSIAAALLKDASAPERIILMTDQPHPAAAVTAFGPIEGYPVFVRVSMSQDGVFGPAERSAAIQRAWAIGLSAAILLLTILVLGLLSWTQRRLTATERVLQDAVDALPDGFVIYDQNDRLYVCNEAYRRIYMRSAEVMQPGTTFKAILEYGLSRGEYPEAGDTPEAQAAWLRERLGKHDLAHREEIVHRAGDRWIRIAEGRTRSGMIAGIRADVTEVKRLEEAVHAQAQQLRQLAQIARLTPNTVIVSDLERRLTWANDTFLEFMGRSLPDMTGQSVPDLLQMDPASAERSSEAVARALAGETVSYEAGQTNRDGVMRWFAISMAALTDEDGATIGIVSVGADITERKRSDDLIRRYSQDLERFAHLASHDLQEPLRKLATWSSRLVQAARDGDEEERDRAAQIIQVAAERGRQLVDDLLRYAKLKDQPVRRTWSNIGALVSAALDGLGDGPESEHRITLDLAETDLYCDAPLVTQVLQNLISNAIKYRKPDQPADVIVRAVHGDSGELRIEVHDSGIGFDQGMAARIFEPFARLVPRSLAAGSGIGLSLVRSVVDKHDWRIQASSVPGVGSVFTVTVPMTDVRCTAPVRAAQAG